MQTTLSEDEFDAIEYKIGHIIKDPTIDLNKKTLEVLSLVNGIRVNYNRLLLPTQFEIRNKKSIKKATEESVIGVNKSSQRIQAMECIKRSYRRNQTRSGMSLGNDGREQSIPGMVRRYMFR